MYQHQAVKQLASITMPSTTAKVSSPLSTGPRLWIIKTTFLKTCLPRAK
jgi:hypothetical protein